MRHCTPAPVSFRLARHVHTAFPSEVKHVLQGCDCERSSRRPGQTHQLWSSIANLAFRSSRVCPKTPLLAVSQIFEPFATGCIIVSACVDDVIRRVIFWKMNVIGISIERKLQHLRSCKMKFIAERQNIRSKYTQVLRDKRQFAKGFLYGSEKFGSRAWNPFAGFRCQGPLWHMPGGRKGTE